ncbi:MAG: hypothetical protein PWQ55_38 [Chloroflexota bacterium]|nr:hypothetical protein [Chloroflexota bacterium]
MTTPKNNTRILFLFSDTGGGHRSAAEAIIEALTLEFPHQFSYEMVDFFLDYAPPPLNLAGPTYPAMSRMDYLWGRAFETSDDPDRMRVIYAMLWPYIRLYMYKLHREHPADVIVSVHPLINTPFLRAKRKRRDITPYITVVTDLVSTHTAWTASRALRPASRNCAKSWAGRRTRSSSCWWAAAKAWARWAKYPSRSTMPTWTRPWWW